MDLDAEIAGAAGSFAGALAGAGSSRLSNVRDGAKASPVSVAFSAPLTVAASSGEAGLAPNPVTSGSGTGGRRPSLAGHCCGATTRGVDPGHGERPGPYPQLTVVLDPAQVTLVAKVGFGGAIGAERIGIRRPPGGVRRWPGSLPCWPIIDGQRPAADPRPAARSPPAWCPAGHRRHRAGQRDATQHPRSDGTESNPQTVHDPRALGCRDVVAAVDAVPDEQHLTSQVCVVGARGGAGLNQCEPVRAVGGPPCSPLPGPPEPASPPIPDRPNRRPAAGQADAAAPSCARNIGQPPLGPSGKPDADAAGRRDRPGNRLPAARRIRWRRNTTTSGHGRRSPAHPRHFNPPAQCRAAFAPG